MALSEYVESGVGHLRCATHTFLILQVEQLIVWDPLALHHIVVKDQYTYEETDAFIK